MFNIPFRQEDHANAITHQAQEQASVSSSQPIQHFPPMIPPYTVLLKDGETTATIYPLPSPNSLAPGLLAFLVDEFNMEIERGDTLPFFETLDMEEFQKYWFGAFAAVMVLGDEPHLDHQRSWEKECLGSFFIRPNFPGRSSHVCTGGFLVNAGIRGKGIGRTLVDVYLDWAPKLGYTSAIFDLVFESNVGARRIFESLNFKRVGKIKAAGILKDHESAVDALIYGKELSKTTSTQGAQVNHHLDNSSGMRFDKIKYYLEYGRYPPFIDRQEKSRLRSSASHYRLVMGKLMLNGREVISDPLRQLSICTEVHQQGHGGINKTTSIITDTYHWSRIKDTVAQVIKNCAECKDPTRPKRKDTHPHEQPPPPRPPQHAQHQSHSTHHQNQHQPHHHHQDSTSDYVEFQMDDPSGLFAAVHAASQQQAQQQSPLVVAQRPAVTAAAHSRSSTPGGGATRRDFNTYDPVTSQSQRASDANIDPEVGGFDDQSTNTPHVQIHNHNSHQSTPLSQPQQHTQHLQPGQSQQQPTQTASGFYDRSFQTHTYSAHTQTQGQSFHSRSQPFTQHGITQGSVTEESGEEIEIARALIEANDGNESEDARQAAEY